MKKVIFVLVFCISWIFADQNLYATSVYDEVYQKRALMEVKQISATINLRNDQFVKLLDLNEQRYKDLDAARFYFSDEPENYDKALAEINTLYFKEIKEVLNSRQYKAVLAMENHQPELVTLAN